MTLSGLESQHLAETLAEIRRIARLTGAEALEATDLLVWTILERHGGTPLADEAVLQEEDEARVRRELLRVRHAIERRQVRTPWDVEALRTEGRALEATNPELAAECLAVAEAADRAAALAQLEALRDKPITTAVAIPGLLAQTAKLSGTLADPEAEAMVQGIRERCARWRYVRRMAEAEVAQVSNPEKAERLRAEARVMLAQDHRADRKSVV